jgi:hypothetical protein
MFALKLGIVAVSTLGGGLAGGLLGWVLLGANLTWTTVIIAFVCGALGAVVTQTWYGWS